jgi:hypothetical protein
VHDHVHPTEGLLRRVEHRRDGHLVGHVSLHRDRPSTRALDDLNGRVGLGLIARIVHHDRETVCTQALGGRSTDAARATGHDRYAGGGAGHGLPPSDDKSMHEQLSSKSLKWKIPPRPLHSARFITTTRTAVISIRT